MINKSLLRMIDENNNRKIKNKCWNEKIENHVTICFVNFKFIV